MTRIRRVDQWIRRAHSSPCHAYSALVITSDAVRSSRLVQGPYHSVRAPTQWLTNRVFATAGIPASNLGDTRCIMSAMPRVPPAFTVGDETRPMHMADGVLRELVHVDDAPDAEYWDTRSIEEGKRVGTLALSARHDLVAVTLRGASVLAVDDDDVQRL